MQNQNNSDSGTGQQTPSSNSGKLIFGILLIVIYIWLASVAVSKKPTYAQMLDPGLDSQGRLDYTRGTFRMYEWAPQSVWNGKHTLILLVTIVGTVVYWKTYMTNSPYAKF